MNAAMVSRFLLACNAARQMRAALPPLPEGMQPRQILIIEVIHALAQEQQTVTVGDVTHRMGGTGPSITKLMNDLVAQGYVEKQQQAEDRRYVSVRLTERGSQAFAYYGDALHRWLAGRLTDVRDDEVETAIRVLHRFAEEVRHAQHEFPKEAACDATV